MGPAVAGTVEKGGDYEENIIKEAEEELGLKNIKPKKSKKIKNKGRYNHFTQWFTLITDKDIEEFRIEEKEVEEIKWFRKQELLEQLKNNPQNFLPKMREYVELFD
ncbi:NUDIX domain-containing protein [Candidatus Pacearchaeota archaeon]|nr:NUDIX domain-containing protein [Candidatus Pacearchaeota archaeon]MBD3283086.1 NUDIX domain-containing protein [Candidatus Pacearchaeota archaeon]